MPGGHLDPDLVEVFARHSDEILGALRSEDLLAATLAAEPRPSSTVQGDALQRACLALAAFTDLKGTHLIGHSTHVAELASSAARLVGLEEGAVTEVRTAALVHDIGRMRFRAASGSGPVHLGRPIASGCGCTHTGPNESCHVVRH